MTEENVTEDPESNGVNERAGPKVTEDHIRAAIDKIDFVRMPETTLTICVLSLKNGIKVVGESACVSMENFDAEIGQEVAYQDAFSKCWPLFGFHLASVLSGWTMDS